VHLGNLEIPGSRSTSDREAHDRYIRKADAEHEQLIWTHPGMATYYRNSQGRVFPAARWRFVEYRAMTHDPDFGQYRLTRV
jgi:4-hydroxyacetophenone monooxygenase